MALVAGCVAERLGGAGKGRGKKASKEANHDSPARHREGQDQGGADGTSVLRAELDVRLQD